MPDFAEFFGDVDPKGRLRTAGKAQALRHRAVLEAHQRVMRQGCRPARVFNLHSFPLTVNLGELGFIHVPPATGESPGIARMANARLSMQDLGDGNFMPVAVLPKELAEEVEREYRPIGGVVAWEGDEDPPADKLQAARERRLEWMRREYAQASDLWTRHHQRRFISDRQRDAARELHREHEIAQLPEWLELTGPDTDRHSCPQCGEQVKRIAKICRFCHSRLDAEAEAPAAKAAVRPAAAPRVSRRSAGEPAATGTAPTGEHVVA